MPDPTNVVEEFLTPKELAARIKCSEQKLANDRYNRRGFSYIKHGSSVLYCWSDVLKDLHSQKVDVR